MRWMSSDNVFQGPAEGAGLPGVAAATTGQSSNAAAAAAAAGAPGLSEMVLHYSGSHFTLSILNHQHKVLLYFDSLGGNGQYYRLQAPEGYETVVLSRPIQGAATCGAHALFVALAYAADRQGLRSACAVQHAGASPLQMQLQAPPEVQSSDRKPDKKRKNADKKQQGGKKSKAGASPDPPAAAAAAAGSALSSGFRGGPGRVGVLQRALAACYGGHGHGWHADALVSAAYWAVRDCISVEQ
jgi:hypothetical protein